jgi:phosphatidylinositol-4,5-bisphosphate 3-kinase
MPELQSANQVKYLEDMMALNLSDQEAISIFREEIITSLNDTWRKIDNFFHNMKRR